MSLFNGKTTAEYWIIDDNNGGDNNDYNLMVIDDNR